MLSEAARTSRVVCLNSYSANSPDLNLLDYYIWNVIERVTKKSQHPNVTSLRTIIEAAFVGMDSTILQRANASDRE